MQGSGTPQLRKKLSEIAAPDLTKASIDMAEGPECLQVSSGIVLTKFVSPSMVRPRRALRRSALDKMAPLQPVASFRIVRSFIVRSLVNSFIDQLLIDGSLVHAWSNAFPTD